MQMSLLRAVAKTKRRKRRLAATTSCWLVLPLSLLLLLRLVLTLSLLLLRLVGVVAHVVTNGRSSPLAVMRVVCGARYTTPGATTWKSAGK
jgi:hypothetical protein